ncbi:hypothetical protein BKA65DRAFT_482944 [Rhexocercosporidium sp. MPI-PUGE-AT-0058]|nr:hypothetical protein BKA65DRAFT_482944 [Rhexocercosporidium sp. MPI-PUGE-AT-0058]
MANQSKLGKGGCVFSPKAPSGLKRVKKALLSVFARESKGKATLKAYEKEKAKSWDVTETHGQVGFENNTFTKLNKFERFIDLPIELQNKIWGYYLVLDHVQRDVHVNLVLKKLPNTLNSDSSIHYTPFLLYAPNSAPPPSLFSISHSSRTFAFKNIPYKFAIPLPLPGPTKSTKSTTITRLIPLDFGIGDTLTVTFPFYSESLFTWIAFNLSPGFTRYVKPPNEVVGELEDGDRRVLKGAGALVVKQRGGFLGKLGKLSGMGKGQRKTVITFRLCEIWEGLDVLEKDTGGGKVVERLKGMPVGEWDSQWIRLIEKLEVEGEKLGEAVLG